MTDNFKHQRAPYEADNPISKPEEDRFGRYPFAKRLAATIAESRVEESLVIGLYAPWGAGKSSVLRFLERELRLTPRALVLSFNPWRYSTEEALLEAFYDEVAGTLKRSVKTEGEKRSKKVAKATRLVPEGINVGIIPVSAVTKAVRSLVEEHSEVSVGQAKERVGMFLREQGLRVVVLLDDLDRLEAVEAHAVLRLVRLNADFPRMTYVVACDAEMVAATLAQRFAGSTEAGRNFLEKIIQVPLSLPPADPLAMREYCLERLSRLLSGPDFPENKAELRRLIEGFDGGVLPMLRTPRMAKRFVNAVEFALPLARGEVNSADIVLLEALRTFHPPLYDQLLGAKECLLGKGGVWDLRDSSARATANGALLAQLLEALPPSNRASARVILEAVFPYVESLRSNVIAPDDKEEWRTLRRAAAPDYFERHFYYGVPQQDLSDIAVAGLVGLLKEGSPELLTKWVAAHINQGNAGLLSTKLAPYMVDLSDDEKARVAVSLSFAGGLVPDRPEFLMPGAQWFLSGRVALTVRSIGGAALRMATAQAVLAGPVRLSFAQKVLRALRPDPGAPTRPGDFDDAELEVLRKRVIERIRDAASNGVLLAEPSLGGLLLEWMNAEGTNATGKWLEEAIEVPGALGQLLSAFAGTSTSMSGGETVPSFGTETYSTLGKVVRADLVEAAIRRSYGEELRPIEEWDPEGGRLSNEEFLARRFLAHHGSKGGQQEPVKEGDD